MAYRLTSNPIPMRTWVVGVIGAALVVAVIGVFAIPRLIPKTPELLYEEDRIKLHKAVVVYITGYSPFKVTSTDVSGPGRFANSKKDILPTYARSYAGDRNAIREEGVSNDPISMPMVNSMPGGSKNQSGTPNWEDVDGDGVRVPANDVLYYHAAYPDPKTDHWNTDTVTSNDSNYVVDSRAWFIDIDDLVSRGFLEEVPDSASSDNSATGKGNYSWYVDSDGTVRSLLYTYPVRETNGFQGVYP